MDHDQCDGIRQYKTIFFEVGTYPSIKVYFQDLKHLGYFLSASDKNKRSSFGKLQNLTVY